MNLYLFTYLVIGITSAVTLYALKDETFFEKSLFSIDAILGSNDYYRILSSIFIHANLGHLFFNMFSFYAFAAGIEMKYGHKVTAYLYLYSGLGAGILSLLLHRNDKNYRAVGASGAVCGIIFASIFLIPGGSIIVFPIPVPIPAWAYAILFVFGSIYATNRMVGGIAHDAHLGGALTGILTAGTIDFEAVAGNGLLLGAVVIPIVLFFVFNRQISSFLQKY
ncbi:MAG TPA: rhomboid family intramembrane serine protease [Spirochaetota bacterium]|nr:rhomboid family intramembrane serine protease [Spirochaetota bacterium]HPS85866.1 rhomboid family intramembrane serine protease [Spirochaetota bacterium]